MPTTPYAAVQVSLNGGANVTGYQAVSAAETVQLSGVNTTDWTTAYWNIYGFPPGWACPSGWQTAADGSYYYSGTQASPNPPEFTLPSSATWGKWGVSLTVNGGVNGQGVANPVQMTDTSLMLDMVSPVLGLHDLMPFEGSQSGGLLREWVYDVQRNLRLLDQQAAAASAVGTPMRLTFSSSSKQIVQSGVTQPVSMNTSGGAFAAIAPTMTSSNDGWVIELDDVAVSWGTHAASITVGSGVSIENPANPGTYVTNGTLALPQDGSASYAWRWFNTESKWKLLD